MLGHGPTPRASASPLLGPWSSERTSPRRSMAPLVGLKSSTQSAFAHAASKVLSLEAISLMRRSDGEAVGAGGAGEEAVGDGGGAEAPGVQNKSLIFANSCSRTAFLPAT